jgi:hypothetical protein
MAALDFFWVERTARTRRETFQMLIKAAGHVSKLGQLAQAFFTVRNQGQGGGMEREEFHSDVSMDQRYHSQPELQGKSYTNYVVHCFA